MGTSVSSFSPSTPVAELMFLDNIIIVEGTTTYELSGIPFYPTKSDVFLNGIRLKYVIEYVISENNLYILENGLGFRIENDMSLIVRWL